MFFVGVCYLRLDFESMDINGLTNSLEYIDTTGPVTACTDKFTITVLPFYILEYTKCFQSLIQNTNFIVILITSHSFCSPPLILAFQKYVEKIRDNTVSLFTSFVNQGLLPLSYFIHDVKIILHCSIHSSLCWYGNWCFRYRQFGFWLFKLRYSFE